MTRSQVNLQVVHWLNESICVVNADVPVCEWFKKNYKELKLQLAIYKQ